MGGAKLPFVMGNGWTVGAGRIARRGALLLIVVCGCAAGRPSPAAPAAPAGPDPRMIASTNVFTALQAGDAALARRDFDDGMRTALPAQRLASDWGLLVTKYGPLASWRLLKTEPIQDHERWIFQLAFRDRSGLGIVVFDRGAHIVGLFFRSGPSARQPGG